MTLSFSEQLDRWVVKVMNREEELFRRVVAHVGRSIMYGSNVTGAPGQPVDTGALLASWRKGGDEEAQIVRWFTELYYAPIIEDNWRGATLRSSVGGFHSVKLTRIAFYRIVHYELRQMNKGGRGGGGVLDPSVGRFRDPSSGRFVSGR